MSSPDRKEQIYATETEEEKIKWERILRLYILLNNSDTKQRGQITGGDYAYEAVRKKDDALLIVYLQLGINPSFVNPKDFVCALCCFTINTIVNFISFLTILLF